MPAYKFTMLFNYISGGEAPQQAIRTGGTTESVYWDDASDQTISQFRRHATYRAVMLPKYCAVVGVRVQQVDPVGASRSFDLFKPGGADIGGQVDAPQLALRIRVKGVGVNNASLRKFAMIPDQQIKDGEYRPTGKYRSAVSQYLRQLSFWKFRGLDLTYLAVPITSIGADGTVTTAADIVLAPGNTVGLRNVEDEDGNLITGEFVVDGATSLRVFKLRNWLGGVCSGGTVKRHVYIYPQFLIPNDTPITVAIKKVGRPFGLYRGRQSKRRK